MITGKHEHHVRLSYTPSVRNNVCCSAEYIFVCGFDDSECACTLMDGVAHPHTVTPAAWCRGAQLHPRYPVQPRWGITTAGR